MWLLTRSERHPFIGLNERVVVRPSSMQIAATKGQYFALNALRAIAALAVVEWHMPQLIFPFVLSSSYLAVDLFFCISGFVIADAYDKRLKKGFGSGRFLVARVLRLYPMYLAATVVGAAYLVMSWLHDSEPTGTVGRALVFAVLLLPVPGEESLGTAALYPFCPPAWSLGFELLVNSLYAVLHRLLTRLTLSLILIASALWVCIAVYRYGSLDVGYTWAHVDGGFPRVIYSFFAGICLRRLSNRWGSYRPAVALVPISILAAVFLADVPDTARPVFDLCVVLFVFPLAVAIGASVSSPNGLTSQVSDYLGELSYPVYLLHYVPLQAFLRLWAGAGLPPAERLAPWTGLAFLSGLLIASAFALASVDRPARHWVKRVYTSGSDQKSPKKFAS